MNIAYFHYKVIATNPVGGSHRHLLADLAQRHEVTVFAVEFESPAGNIEWVRIPVPTRPLALLFVAFHLVAPIAFLVHGLRRRKRYDLVLMIESNLAFGDVASVHFCHSAFLKYHWTRGMYSGLRGLARWLDHALHALLEPLVYFRVRHIVVPSKGLASEVAREFPSTRSKITVIPNPIDLERCRPPESLDRRAVRQSLGFEETDIVLCFVALGHFERKGLPYVIAALEGLSPSAFRLVVVGGERNVVSAYQDRASRFVVARQVVFVGMQRDVRPYLWASDAFVLPSHYETFCKVAFEAAAASLPLIVCGTHGIEEMISDGQNGFVVTPSSGSVESALRRFGALSLDQRREMGHIAQRSVQRYSIDAFVASWRKFLEDYQPAHKFDHKRIAVVNRMQ